MTESIKKFQCVCGKEYKYSNGLYTHKKKCKMEEKVEEKVEEKEENYFTIEELNELEQKMICHYENQIGGEPLSNELKHYIKLLIMDKNNQQISKLLSNHYKVNIINQIMYKEIKEGNTIVKVKDFAPEIQIVQLKYLILNEDKLQLITDQLIMIKDMIKETDPDSPGINYYLQTHNFVITYDVLLYFIYLYKVTEPTTQQVKVQEPTDI